MKFKKIAFRLLAAVNYFNRHVSIYNHPAKQELLPSELIRFDPEQQEFLEKAASSFNYEFDYSLGYRQKPVWLAELSDITILGNSGGMIQHGTGPDKIITESVFDIRRLAASPAWRMPSAMLPNHKKGKYAAIFHQPWATTSNYHWFIDCLPRLYAILQTVQEPLTILMPEFAPNFQRETLEMLLQEHPNITVQTIKKHEKFRCEYVVFSSFVSGQMSGFLPPAISDFLLNGIRKGYKTEMNIPEKRIYISRSKAPKRRILNEADLVPILEKHGFEIVHPEYLTYRDQVQLFSDSRYIIGAHGAGLTNTFFAQKATLLELHPQDLIKPHYFLLCKGLGFDYKYLTGGKPDENLDFLVDVKKFEEVVQGMVS